MKLQEESIRWAINHLLRESDTDLYPKPLEIDIIAEMKEDVVSACLKIDISTYKWNSHRRFLIPKDEISYRLATQLNPIDNIVLLSLIHEYGQNIENRRSDNAISYRFSPDDNGSLYSTNNSWFEFWNRCKHYCFIDEDEIDDQYSHVLYCDISDFYNQIYHHTIENQLIESGFPNQAKKQIMALLELVTAKISRGIPIGPHATHLLAEMSLIPFDKTLKAKGYRFIRYVDDIVVFCENVSEAKSILYDIADILDKQQRLVLQKGKTKIYNIVDFINHTKDMLLDNPINEKEEIILKVIRSYSRGNAYSRIKLSDITNEHLSILSKESIISLLEEYLNAKEPNFSRIRWFYRRLSQIGLPHAVEFSIDNIDRLIPALNDVCLYINSCAENYVSDWKDIGENILSLLEHSSISNIEYFKITLLNLFVRNPKLNHTKNLISRYKKATKEEQRKILLASVNNIELSGWISTLKESYNTLDEWTQYAFLISTRILPKEERSYFLKAIKAGLDETNDIMENIIIKWSLAK
jgi:retron-type reverse transcriptase